MYPIFLRWSLATLLHRMRTLVIFSMLCISSLVMTLTPLNAQRVGTRFVPRSEPVTKVPLSPAATSTSMGDVAVDVANNTIKKLNANDGSVLWSAGVTNDGALAVDPFDLGVYTGNGSHISGGSGTAYKFDSSGNLWWSAFINRPGTCNFFYVNDVAVDATNQSAGVVWSEHSCFGGMAKTDRTSGGEAWGVFTNDIGRPSIDPGSGQIFTTTNAGPGFSYNTLYSSTSGGGLTTGASCEGYTDINPADHNLYRGGNMNSNGCGLFLSQMNKATLVPNWTMNLAGPIASFDSLATSPANGFIYVGSVASSRIVVVNPATQSIITSFPTIAPPASIAVNPINGNLFIASGTTNFVYSYSPFGGLAWVSGDLGGTANVVAAPRAVSTATPAATSSDFAANGSNNRIYKFSGLTGNMLWTAAVVTDGAIAVDPVDFGVYTGLGGHNAGPTNVYKYNTAGTVAWSNTLGPVGGCAFYYVGNASVDATSATPGVVWTSAGCNGYIAKSNRNTGAQMWSNSTADVGRATVDPASGDIFTTTFASPAFGYNTLYKATGGGGLTSASSCEGYTDLNPADGMLYRGGNNASNGCGNVLYQINKTTLVPNWSVNLSASITSFDSIAVQPWSGGAVYVGSVSSKKILVVNPATQTIIRTINTIVGPAVMAVSPNGGDIFITDRATNFIYGYNQKGTLIWTSPNLGSTINTLASPRGVVGLAPSAAGVSVSGRVLTAAGTGLSRVKVSLTDPSGTVLYAFSNAFGDYRFDNVESGNSYVLAAAANRYAFTSQLISVSNDLTGVDIIASR